MSKRHKNHNRKQVMPVIPEIKRVSKQKGDKYTRAYFMLEELIRGINTKDERYLSLNTDIQSPSGKNDPEEIVTIKVELRRVTDQFYSEYVIAGRSLQRCKQKDIPDVKDRCAFKIHEGLIKNMVEFYQVKKSVHKSGMDTRIPHKLIRKMYFKSMFGKAVYMVGRFFTEYDHFKKESSKLDAEVSIDIEEESINIFSNHNI